MALDGRAVTFDECEKRTGRIRCGNKEIDICPQCSNGSWASIVFWTESQVSDGLGDRMPLVVCR
jgi:hypothetical protein